MKSFTDETGDAWRVAVNYATAKRVKDEAGFDLLEAARGNVGLLTEIVADPYAMGTVFWALCRPEAEERGLNPESFAERFCSADVVENAVDALTEAVIDFFPKPSRATARQVLTKARVKIHQRQTAAEERARTLIEDGTLDKLLDDSLDSEFSNSAASSPDPRASIRIHSPSANSSDCGKGGNDPPGGDTPRPAA